MKKLVVVGVAATVLLVSGCGTIRSQDYTDLAIEKAVLDARVAAAEQARQADKDRVEMLREAIMLYINKMQNAEGRRPHKPGGA